MRRKVRLLQETIHTPGHIACALDVQITRLSRTCPRCAIVATSCHVSAAIFTHSYLRVQRQCDHHMHLAMGVYIHFAGLLRYRCRADRCGHGRLSDTEEHLTRTGLSAKLDAFIWNNFAEHVRAGPARCVAVTGCWHIHQYVEHLHRCFVAPPELHGDTPKTLGQESKPFPVLLSQSDYRLGLLSVSTDSATELLDNLHGEELTA